MLSNEEFVKENLKQTGTEPLKDIHNRIKDFISVDEFDKVNELIELFLKADADIGRLRSILVITKYWRNDATIEANLKKAVELLKAKTGREVV